METSFYYRKLLLDSGKIGLLSITGNVFLSATVGQLKFNDLVITNFPNPLGGIPFATSGFDLPLKFYFFKADAKADDLIAGNGFQVWLPERFLDDQFDGLEPLALLSIVPVANIEQGLTILGDQPFSAGLSWFQFLAQQHGAEPLNGWPMNLLRKSLVTRRSIVPPAGSGNVFALPKADF